MLDAISSHWIAFLFISPQTLIFLLLFSQLVTEADLIIVMLYHISNHFFSPLKWPWRLHCSRVGVLGTYSPPLSRFLNLHKDSLNLVTLQWKDCGHNWIICIFSYFNWLNI
uniref:Uncharacterized protein n=1 Tax=Sphaerodactylus townsendi TaxID=933632 RepID=A0ACB8GBD3_9SAUR